jgi:hypothetical protein
VTVSDGCKYLEEIGDSVSVGSKWLNENGGCVSDGLCMRIGEWGMFFGRQYMYR